MIIALLALIVFILLFGAGVVKGWLANAASLAVGGGVVLMLALWLGSYLGEYGLIWVILIVAALFGLAVLTEDYIRARRLASITGRNKDDDVDPAAPINSPSAKGQPQFHSRAPSREERKKARDR